MPIYTLYLSTQVTSPVSSIIVPVNKSNLANVSWNIDWDNLFRKEQYNYKHCRVRFSLVTDRWTSGAGNTDWDDYQGYLACSLPSSYNAVTTNGTLLGLIYPTDIYTLTASTEHGYVINNMEELGVDVSMPNGNSILSIMFLNHNSRFISITPEYQIMLSFELYDRKK